MPSTIVLIYLLLFGLHLILLRIFVLPHLPPVGLPLIIVAYGLHLLIIVLYALSRDWGNFWAWYFNYKFGEYNPAASFASAQYLLIAALALLIALLAQPRRWWQRLYWLMLSGFFVFLALDEYLAIHETTIDWELYYLAVAVLLFLLSATLYWFALSRQDFLVFVLLFGGMGIAALGGVGLEFLGAWGCQAMLAGVCNDLPLIEEVLENIGILTTMLGVLIYAWRHIPLAAWRKAQRLALGAGLGSGLLLVTGPFFGPALEFRLTATPVSVDYLGDNLSLLGYRSDQSVIAPGDTLHVSLYWRRNGDLNRDYGLSLHLVDSAEGQSFAQVNKRIVQPMFQNAAEGVVYRSEVWLTLAPDAPTPRSYWLSFSLWHNRKTAFIPEPISSTDRRTLTDLSAVLGSIAVVTSDPEIHTSQNERYDFEEALSLLGYSVETNGEALSLQFAWEAGAELNRDYTQFIHVFTADSDFAFNQDQPPFNGAFPTKDWPAGLRARDVWQIPLPEELAPGRYKVYTGLYDSETRTRLPVSNAAGEIQTDGLIPLGEVQFNSQDAAASAIMTPR